MITRATRLPPWIILGLGRGVAIRKGHRVPGWTASRQTLPWEGDFSGFFHGAFLTKMLGRWDFPAQNRDIWEFHPGFLRDLTHLTIQQDGLVGCYMGMANWTTQKIGQRWINPMKIRMLGFIMHLKHELKISPTQKMRRLMMTVR